MLATTHIIVQQKLKELFPSLTNHFQFSYVAGGSINETYKIVIHQNELFCKINSATKFPQLFEKERNALAIIGGQNIIKTPQVIHCFTENETQILLLEWIKEGERTKNFWKKFGEQLAALHTVSIDFFGLSEDNYMGSVKQNNTPANDWVEFFIHFRIKSLVDQCIKRNLLQFTHQGQFENLYKKLPSVFDKKDKPALLHGDLWSGNFMCNQEGEPVVIDPAIYFGHSAVDLAMTTLFRGFDLAFYESYNYHSPFPSNYKEQWKVCNLYPLLIHLFLFGKAYLPQIEQTLNCFN